MKTVRLFSIDRLSQVGVFFVALAPGVALAADPQWRPTYDAVMMYVNFAILVAVVVKYGREPIKSFLKQQKEDVVSELNRLEDQKKRIVADIQAAHRQAQKARQRLEQMKLRTMAKGENKKRQMVEQAQKLSALMIEEARRKMENRIVQARNSLKMELLDMAIEQAMVRLPDVITEGDNQRLLDAYMHGMKP